MVEHLRPISRALISVSDKTGLIAFGPAAGGLRHRAHLHRGTARALAGAGLKVRDVAT